MIKGKITQVIFTILVLVSIACCNLRNTKEHEKTFSKIFNVEQISTSDTIKKVDEFSTIPQKIYKTISFTILDSSFIVNHKTHFPFKSKNANSYISFINDTLFLSDLKQEQTLLILNAKIGTVWEVNRNALIPKSQTSKSISTFGRTE